MSIKINNKEIQTGKLYDEYSEDEKKILPPLNSKFKTNWRLGYDGKWYKDTSN